MKENQPYGGHRALSLHVVPPSGRLIDFSLCLSAASGFHVSPANDVSGPSTVSVLAVRGIQANEQKVVGSSPRWASPL